MSVRPSLPAIWRAGFFVFLAGLSAVLARAAEPWAIHWVPEGSPTAVEVSGIPAPILVGLGGDALIQKAPALLSVYAEQPEAAPDRAMPAILGWWKIVGDRLRFEPRFPFTTGVRYRAEFAPAQLPGGATSAAVVTAFFTPAPPKDRPATVVTQIYPSGEVLPENQLKFYLQFSAPMSRGSVYEHVKLRDAAGQEIELPFLELDEELWDPAMTRLTLLIDPGRIKRGVKPLEDLGAVFEEGKSYTFTVDPTWRDAAGQPLREAFTKKYRVAAADRTPPDTARWTVRPPSGGTRAPLVVEFDEPMDRALALRMIGVADGGGLTIAGESALADGERRWSFVPSRAWAPGPYHLIVATTIEDLAGNNIGKPFDVDVMGEAPRRLEAERVVVRFEVK